MSHYSSKSRRSKVFVVVVAMSILFAIGIAEAQEQSLNGSIQAATDARLELDLGNSDPDFGIKQPSFGNRLPVFGEKTPVFGDLTPTFGNAQWEFGQEGGGIF